jgi:hypothetical protein
MTPAPQGFATLSAEAACAALRASGLVLEPADLQLAPRDERWAITLPGNRMAWFAASAAGQERLAAERRVLRLLARRCTFQVPHVVYEDPAGFDVRDIVSASATLGRSMRRSRPIPHWRGGSAVRSAQSWSNSTRV